MPQKKANKKKNQKAKVKAESLKVKPKNDQKKNKIVERHIDASGKVLGRLASEIAVALRGKDKPSFRPYLVMGDKVIVNNASKIVITGNKLEQKTYYHHTGYLGHLKAEKLKDVMAKNPAEVLRRAVWGMLPKNKLRDRLIKNLTISN